MGVQRAEIQALVRRFQEVNAATPDGWGDIDLTITQLRALFVLARRQPMRVSDLAQALRISVASASALRERLARQGYVTRQHGVEDQRTVLLALSPKAGRLLSGLARRSTLRLTSTLERMTVSERTAFAVTLNAMVRLADGPARASRPRARKAT